MAAMWEVTREEESWAYRSRHLGSGGGDKMAAMAGAQDGGRVAKMAAVWEEAGTPPSQDTHWLLMRSPAPTKHPLAAMVY